MGEIGPTTRGSGDTSLRCLRRISHPAAIVPIAVITSLWFGRYSPQQITELQEVPLFLQGSRDMGGSDLFAATMALYVVFGVLGAFYLTFALSDLPTLHPWPLELPRALWILKWHVAAFVFGGTSNWEYDSRIGPNDFRNMFLFVSLLYAGSILLVVAVSRTNLSLPARLTLAPGVICLWLVVGSDGNTAKAGQVVMAGQDPRPVARSIRHGLMLRWHEVCDSLLGDLKKVDGGSVRSGPRLQRTALLAPAEPPRWVGYGVGV